MECLLVTPSSKLNLFAIIGTFKQNSVFERLISESGPYLVPNSADGRVASAMISIERLITLLPGDGTSTSSWNNNASSKHLKIHSGAKSNKCFYNVVAG